MRMQAQNPRPAWSLGCATGSILGLVDDPEAGSEVGAEAGEGKKCRAVNASVATALATADLVDGADDERRRRGGWVWTVWVLWAAVGVVDGDREVP